MSKIRFRAHLRDGLFVAAVMAAAMASAALEVSAVLNAFSQGEAKQLAKAEPAKPARRDAAASSVDGALLSAAGPRSARLAR